LVVPRGKIKTAIVVEEGLTKAIVQLWIKDLAAKVPFKIRIVHSLADAQKWLGVADSMVA